MRAAPLRRPATILLPALALLALAAIAGLLWLPPADQAQAQSGQTVAADWALIPNGIEPGDSFRLLFVTSTTRDASSSNIADYNSHARSAAGNNSSLADFSSRFTALISTSSVDARDNTGTTGSGVPIHWLGGEKVADDYADLYDGSWDSVAGKTEAGGAHTGLVWTGGNKAGQKSVQRHAGAEEVRLGDPGDAGSALSSPNAKASSQAHPLYALSPVLTVAQPEPEPTPTPTPTPTPQPEPAPSGDTPAIADGPAIASNPASGDTYGEGEAIEVSVTFSEAVTVTGEPRVRLTVGERKRWARYSAGSGTATLTFTYTVRDNDRDEDGVRIPRNALKLNGGTIVDSDGNAASLKSPALSDQSGHKVEGSLEEPSEGQSGEQQQSSNSPPAFAADTDTRSVDENSAAGTNVGAPVTATDADNDTLTYALTGSDAFAIGENSGQITVAAALDYEAQQRHILTVSVSDGRNGDGEADTGVDDTLAVTVSIGNVDEPGRVILNTARPQAGAALTAAVSDPDGIVAGSVSWQWQRSPDGTTAQNVDTANFDDIPGETGASIVPTDADDAGRWLRAKATYSDSLGAGNGARARTANPVAAEPQGKDPQPQGTDTSPPTVSAVSIASSPAPIPGTPPTPKTYYAPGEVIKVVFTFNENIVVTGMPTVNINIGGAHRSASCVRHATNHKQLVCSYTVVKGDGDTDGISINANSALRLNGATIQDGSSNDATLTHQGLSHQTGHRVGDDVAPWPLTIAVVSSPAAGETYRRGDEYIIIKITFSEAIELRGVPRIGVQIGQRESSARCVTPANAVLNEFPLPAGVNPSDPRSLLCYHRLGDGDTDEDGISIGRNRLKNPGDIRSIYLRDVKNRAILWHDPLPDQSGHKVDVEPAAVWFSASAGRGYVNLAWDNPRPLEADIAKYQYRQKEGGGPYGEWTDVRDISPNTTSHVVIGLSNGTAYTFQVRAVDQGGQPSPNSREVSATPLAKANRPPEFGAVLLTRAVSGNAAAGDKVGGGAVVATDADGDALTYSLSGRGRAEFSIDGAGQIRVAQTRFPFPSRKVYILTVSVHDGKAADGSASSAQDDTVTVNITVH